MPTLQAPVPLQQFNQDGAPVSGGKLFVYYAGSTSKVTTYIDSAGSTPNTNPIILDSNGQCKIWLTPGSSYKFVLSPPDDTDPPSNSYWTADNINAINDVAATAGGGAGASVVLQTGDVKFFAGPEASLATGWLSCSGRPVSRFTYSYLFAAIGTTWGAGDGSSTFNLPDLRGRAPVGADTLGSLTANVLTSASIGTSATIGVRAGSQQAPAHTHTTTVVDPGHTHTLNVIIGEAGTNALSPQGGNYINNGPIPSATTGISVNVATAGSGTSLNIPPVAVGVFAIWALDNVTA